MEGGGGLGGHKEEPWGQHMRRHGGSQVFGYGRGLEAGRPELES